MDSQANLLDNGGAEICGAPGRPILVARSANPTCFIDRWWGHRGGDVGYGIGNLGGDGFPNRIAINRDQGNTRTTPIVIGQSTGVADVGMPTVEVVARMLNRRIPGVDAQTLVFSVYAYKGRQFSGTGVTLEIVTAPASTNICSGAWTVEASSTFAAAQLSESAWTRLQVTKSGRWTAPLVGVLGVRVRFDAPSGIAGADDGLYISGAKLELSSTGAATAYVMPTMDESLRRCKRFYQEFGGAATQFSASGYAAGGSSDVRMHLFPEEMIRAPVATKSGAWSVTNCAQPSIRAVTRKGFTLSAVATATGAFSYSPNSADDLLVFDAEI